MPGSNTSHLPQTLVSLPGQLLGVPPAGHSLEPVTLRHTDDVHHLVLGEHGRNWDLLLEMIPSEVDLISNGASVKRAFFCLRLKIFIWVWTRTRMTVQYFFI